ncbi:hypothetical protein QR77_13305 [Streptomyces sp. 150FB]|uniref:hypothetical protein n=1 Tax=Streptomyces sp. 150FB TaxID=1576605 RepID=UPI0005893A3C|nr:hypothetical protein [Streptomyces sp. 150FB]KIF74682.1 hypothetical protein QR77_13305 [Streptomyces sp. 150FB]
MAMRRWIKVTVAAAAVLGVGGYIAQPYAKDWVLTGQACDGALPRDVTGQLVPDGAHLTEERSQQIDGLGSYGCDLRFEGDGDAVGHIVLDAYTRRDDQDAEFMTLFPEGGQSTVEALPDGLPGFVDEYRGMHFLVPCPDLGKDADGRQRKLLTRVSLQRRVDAGVPGAAYRMAVSLTNAASDRLGCGAKPLSPPKKDVPLADPEKSSEEARGVPLAEAKDTACGWAAGAGLPEPATWRALGSANENSPVASCVLLTGDPDSEDGSRMYFRAWYGDWSRRLTKEYDDRVPVSATARCDGEAATFAPAFSDDIPGVDKGDEQRIFKLFAEDQVRRHGCSDLRLPF